MNEKKIREEQETFKEIWGVKPTKKELESLKEIGRKMRERGVI